MQMLVFLTSPHCHAKRVTSRGFSLLELLVCMGLLGAMASFAIPSWQRLQERSRIESARDQLMNDLQTARIRALQRGEALQLTRLNDCTWATTSDTDWSCGWKLVVKADQTALQHTPQPTPLEITFAKNNPLDISARGDLGTVGDRWVIKSRQAALNVSNVLCLNSAGRLRWQTGETCSN